MVSTALTDTPVWQKLKERAAVMKAPQKHLKHLVDEPGRREKYCISGAQVLLDYCFQRVDGKTMTLLWELAEERRLKERFAQMVRGEKVNFTEGRAAVHTAARDFSKTPIIIDNEDIKTELHRVHKQTEAFSRALHRGKIAGSTGKPFRHVVVIGIGGSYLGTEFVSEALAAHADKGIRIHYLSNVDIGNFGKIVSEIEPESTLWIIISKSFTTPETAANANQAKEFMVEKGLDPDGHFVTVTSKGSPGDRGSAAGLGAFHMFDAIGGRYSVTSAVGGVPLSIYLGYNKFEAFLNGAHEMDVHTQNAPIPENLPLVAALLSVWNNDFLGYPAQAVIPYSTALRKLPAHVQQLNMESNGKSACETGGFAGVETGTIVFGEPGTNAQHSFFQLAHQGRAFPIDFIGVLEPSYPHYTARSKGVTNHQELWANLIAQAKALAVGKDHADPNRHFPGNRPCSIITLKRLNPEDVGRLLAFYEARTVYESFLWGINAFDQFGVELGKTLAAQIRQVMERRNKDAAYVFPEADPHTACYLKLLFDK